MSPISPRRLLPLAALLTLLLASCAPESSATGPAPTSSGTPSAAPSAPSASPSDDPGSDTPAGTLDATAAADAALRAVPGTVVELELGREGTTAVWEAVVLTPEGAGVELYLDLRTGDVLRQRDQRLDSVQQTAPVVTAHDAIDAALATQPGRVVSLDLDTERGRTVWEVVVIGTRGGVELYIDAETAEILKQEPAS